MAADAALGPGETPSMYFETCLSSSPYEDHYSAYGTTSSMLSMAPAGGGTSLAGGTNLYQDGYNYSLGTTGMVNSTLGTSTMGTSTLGTSTMDTSGLGTSKMGTGSMGTTSTMSTTVIPTTSTMGTTTSGMTTMYTTGGMTTSVPTYSNYQVSNSTAGKGYFPPKTPQWDVGEDWNGTGYQSFGNTTTTAVKQTTYNKGSGNYRSYSKQGGGSNVAYPNNGYGSGGNNSAYSTSTYGNTGTYANNSYNATTSNYNSTSYYGNNSSGNTSNYHSSKNYHNNVKGGKGRKGDSSTYNQDNWNHKSNTWNNNVEHQNSVANSGGKAVSKGGERWEKKSSTQFDGRASDTNSSTQLVAAVPQLTPAATQQIEALNTTSKAIIQNTVSTSKKKKAQQKAEAAKQRKILHPLAGDALIRVETKNQEVDDYHAGKRDRFLIGEHTIIKRTSFEELAQKFGVAGLDERFPKKRKYFKYACVYDVQIQNEEHEFTVCARLGGNDGENMRGIVRTNKETHLSMQGNNVDEPLILKIDTNSQAAYEYSMQSVEVILRKVYLQLDAWAVDKDNVGKNISLKIRKLEKNTNYKSIFPQMDAAAAHTTKPETKKSNKKSSIVDSNPIIKARGDAPDYSQDEVIITTPNTDSVDPITMFSSYVGKPKVPAKINKSKSKAQLPTLHEEMDNKVSPCTPTIDATTVSTVSPGSDDSGKMNSTTEDPAKDTPGKHIQAV